MRSKAPLVMMEQIVMVLIFALAAALCLQAFVLSGQISNKMEAKNRAVVEAQNAAETLKSGGLKQYMEEYAVVQDGEVYKTLFDKDWNIVPEEKQAKYSLELTFTESELPNLWRAVICVSELEGEELFTIPAAGQTEVMQSE